MDYYIYDRSLQLVGIIDNCTSVIWTLRYSDVGDFELYIKSSPEILELCKINYYIVRESDNTVMIIKSITQTENVEDGDYITITGVSVESVISQRVVWNPTTIWGRVEQCVYSIVDANIINPTFGSRRITGMATAPIKRLPGTVSLTNFAGNNVLELVKQLCDSVGYGFRIKLSNSTFIFEVYSGVDRSRNQNVNPWVIFDAESVSESTTLNDYSQYKNVALVGGSGEYLTRRYAAYGSATGVDRYETFVTANASNVDLLISAGREAIQKTKAIKKFDGEISDYYAYGVNYGLGDIVEIETKNGVTAVSQVVELIQSIDESGIYTIPTFSEWESI